MRRFVVDGVPVEVPVGESALDLARIYPDGVGASNGTGEFREGTRWAEVTFVLDAPEAGTYRLGVLSDWFGRFLLDGGEALEQDGPGVVRLPLEKGRNEIRYRSRAGRSGKWFVRMKFDATPAR